MMQQLAKPLTILASIVAALCLPGCNTGEPHRPVKPSLDPPAQLPKAAPAQPEPSMSNKKPAPPDALMTKLYAQTSAASGMPQEQITLVRAEAAVWGDSSMGCPQPNVGYTQVVTRGYWVILRAGREEFDYRVNHRQHIVRCTGATKQPPIVYPDDT